MWNLNVVLALLGLLVLGSASANNLYHDKPHVQVLDTLGDFEATVSGDSLWMVQFCTTTDEVCQKMAVAYGIIGELFRGVVRLAMVPTDTEGGQAIAARFSVPTNQKLTLFWFLDDKSSPKSIDLKMQVDGVDALVQHMMQTMSDVLSSRGKQMGIGEMHSKSNDKQQKKKKGSSGSSATVTVTGADEWEQKVMLNPLVTLVAFTAPWCGHCKMLKSDWDEAAAKVDGEGAQLVWVDATDPANAPLSDQFQVQGFPTILIFPGGAPKDAKQARQYPGERKTAAMVKYVLGEVDQSGTPKEIPELVSPELLQTECQGHNHICVLAALPHILEATASGRNKHKELLGRVSKTFRGGAFSFLWLEGGSQPALESALQLTFGYPALVAYSMDRHAFAVLHGSFSEKSMTSFLHGVTSGRVPVVKLKKEKVPKIEVVEPWDGQDAAPPEEEFDLADIMGSSDDDDEEEKQEGGGGANEEL